MRIPKNPLYLILVSSCYLVSFIPSAYAYGPEGHALTAQVAQRFLSPKTRAAVKEIIPKSQGQLDAIASWADNIKTLPEYYFASGLHFLNPPNDYPPSHCEFEWRPGHADVISAIYNYTRRLGDHTLDAHQHEDALKFLVHFLGDMHQPLHITGRDKGGNDANATFEGHQTKLHQVWDRYILNKQMRELNGTYLDYVLDLLKTTWSPFITEWASCPGLGATWTSDGLRLSTDDIPVCPDFWGAQVNSLNCEYAWRDYTPTTELSDGIYWSRIEKNKVVERLIAMAGVRMAAVLNTVLGGKEENTVELQEELSEVQIWEHGWVVRWRKWFGMNKGRFMNQN